MEKELKTDKPLPTSENTISPKFNHAEINNLYKYGVDIPMDMLLEITSLPRTSLIADLEMVLIDAVDRYNYFNKLEWENETHTFPIHAMFLLMELKAEESLHAVLQLFTNNYTLISDWFNDLLTEDLWQCFLVIGFNDIQSIKNYLLISDLDGFVKCPATEALSQIALHYPERKGEIIDAYSQILNHYIHTEEVDFIIDSGFLALLVGDIIDAKLEELLPLIKKLYELNYVSHGVNGNYTDAVRHMTDNRNHKRKIATLEELYKPMVTMLNYFKNQKNTLKEEPKKLFTPAPITSKIGRNDPCPCGSGKKYKKCCLS